MRVLILHARFGMGHISAAQALQEAFVHEGIPDTYIADTLDFTSPVVSKAFTRAYEWQTEQVPALYRRLYQGSDPDTSDGALSSSRILGILGRPFLLKLLRHVDDLRPDVIVCVHPLPAQVLRTLFREAGPAAEEIGAGRPPLYVVTTDFHVHNQWLTRGVAGFFVASALSRDLLLARGISGQHIHVTGIPIRLEIAEPKPPEVMRRRHRLPPTQLVITFFGSGIDRDHVRLIVTRLLSSSIGGVLIVVSGRHRTLAQSLRDVKPAQQMRLRVLGKIDYVDDLVAASDLVIAKAGGLMVAETLARGTPLVVVDPLPGQEEWNADYVVATGGGIQLRLAEMVAPAVLNLLAQPERLAALRARARASGRPLAAVAIARHILAEVTGAQPRVPEGASGALRT
jgi:processive 1,2-diacylglycerol beta-glucosyltransferase